MAQNPNLIAALTSHLIYILAMVASVISPALQKKSPYTAVLHGALLGPCCYATYDLTNLAGLLLSLSSISFGGVYLCQYRLHLQVLS